MSSVAEGVTIQDPTSVGVGNEMGDPMGYFLSRTKRLERLVAAPEGRALVERLVEHMDAWCEHEGVRPQDLNVGGVFARGLFYADFEFQEE